MVETRYHCEKCPMSFEDEAEAREHEAQPITELPTGFVYSYTVERRPTFPNCMAVDVITGETSRELDINHSKTYDAKTYGNGVSKSFDEVGRDRPLEPRRGDKVYSKDVRHNLEDGSYRYLTSEDARKLLTLTIRSRLLISGVSDLVLDLEGKVKVPVKRFGVIG